MLKSMGTLVIVYWWLVRHESQSLDTAMIILFILVFLLSILVFYFANKTRNQAIALEEAQQQLSREINERQRAETALQQLQVNFETSQTEQEELIRQNQLLQSFFQVSPIGLGIFDPELKYLQINKALAEIHGIPVEEHLGKTVEEIIPELAPTLKAILHQVLATGEPIIKLEIWGETVKQSGLQHWEASYFPLLGKDNCFMGIGCTIMDASDRVRTEMALRENEERFRQITENIREVFYLSDLRQPKVLYVNPAYETIWGRSCQSLYERLSSFLEAVHPEDLSRVRECLERQKRGESTRCEYKIVRPDGSVRWVWDRCFPIRDENGEPYRWCGVVEDITDRKQLEESCQQSLHRLKNLHQLDRAILKLQEPAAIAISAIHHLQQMIPCQRITIGTFDWEAEVAKILLTEGVGNDLVGSGFQLFDLKSISNLTEQLQQKISYVIGDLSLFPDLPSQTQALKARGLNRFISFPLRAGNDLLGVLNLWLDEPEILTNEQLDIAMEVSAQIAIALQQANLYQKIQTYATQLEERVTERTVQLESLNQQLEDFTYSASHDLRAPLRAMQGFATAILEDYGEHLDDLGRQYAQRLVICRAVGTLNPRFTQL